MNTGFFRNCHDSFEPFVLINAKSDRNFIKRVGSKYFFEIVNIADNVHIAVRFTVFLLVIQNAVYDISPFGMCKDTVDIALCRTAVTDEKDML